MKCICGKCSEGDMKKREEEYATLTEKQKIAAFTESMKKMDKFITLMSILEIMEL